MVTPRISVIQEGDSAFADESLVWLRSVGVRLDEWQEFVLRSALLRRDDRWSAMDVGLNVGRQNGKGEIILGRCLVQMYRVPYERENLTIYSAHNFDTAKEHFLRLVSLIEGSPELEDEVEGKKGSRSYGITWGAGTQGVKLRGNRRFLIRTRTSGGGRGFSSDLLIEDEGMFLAESFNSSLRPVISARPDPQIWLAGSAVDQAIHENGIVFARMRKSAIDRDDSDLTYFEWSAGNGTPLEDHPERFTDLDDQAAWAQANPALGIRIDPRTLQAERRRMSARGFAVERLGVGDWPAAVEGASVLDLDAWDELEDTDATFGDSICLCFDVSPERRGSISAAGRAGGRWMVEVVEERSGTGWMVKRLQELVEEHHPAKVVCDAVGPAASLVPELAETGIEVETVTAQEHGQACARLVDAVDQGTLVHIGQPELANAIRSAGTRPLGDSWAWSRRNSSGNISPLVSTTLALSAAIVHGDREFVVAWG